MTYHANWAIACLVMAAIPWIGAAWLGGMSKVTLTQIALMFPVLAIGFVAPRLGLNGFYVLAGMLVWSVVVVTVGPEDRSRRLAI